MKHYKVHRKEIRGVLGDWSRLTNSERATICRATAAGYPAEHEQRKQIEKQAEYYERRAAGNESNCY
jgi:hypothetical protein